MPIEATDEQKAIIHAPFDKHIKVVASPGSGKSWSMCRRVAHLIDSGEQPSSILVLMYNKKAKEEFEEKLSVQLHRAFIPSVRTFHSLGNRLCGSLKKKGFLNDSRLEQSSTTHLLMAKRALKESMGSNKSVTCDPNKPAVIDAFSTFIELAKSDIRSPGIVFDDNKIDTVFYPFVKGFELFETLRKDAKIRFFNDLIYDPVKEILKNQKAYDFVSNRLRHIIIDEYQDINNICQELVKILSGKSAVVTAVGDDDQCLYSYRGSKPEYLINLFDADFPNPIVFTLTNTHRYGHAIALASNNVITNNEGRVDKLCIASKANPSSIIEVIVETNKQTLSTNPIPGCIKKWQGSPSDIAILVRVFSMTPEIEFSLIQAGISYRIEGRASVFNLNVVSALIDVLMIANKSLFNLSLQEVQEAVFRVLLLPHPGVSNDKLKALAGKIASNPGKLIEIVGNEAATLSPYIGVRIKRKADAIQTLIDKADWTATDVLEIFTEMTECEKQISNMALNAADADASICAIQSFISFCKQKEACLDDLIEELRTLRSSDGPPKGANVVTITSIHRAKGLDYPMVIIPGLSEGLFPYIRDDGDVDIESERRIFLVGITRAKHKLILVVPNDDGLIHSITNHSSMIPAGLHGNPSRASRFVYEANLKPCLKLSADLNKNAQFSDLTISGDPKLFNQYLTKVRAQFRLSPTISS